MSGGEQSPAVVADDLRALAEIVPFERHTLAVLERAAELLAPCDPAPARRHPRRADSDTPDEAQSPAEDVTLIRPLKETPVTEQEAINLGRAERMLRDLARSTGQSPIAKAAALVLAEYDHRAAEVAELRETLDTLSLSMQGY